MYNSLLAAIGNTPIVKISNSKNIFAKLEYLNPGGSVKDRSALYMIQEAEKLGLLLPGGTIIEASSGNQGIATAMIGAARGYKVIITVFEKASEEKVATLRAYGATVIKCPQTEFVTDPESYHSHAVRLHQQIPGSFMLNQYFNISNADAHYSSLGPEIWKQTNGKITHFIAAAGTGGTISGAGKFLKEQNPNIKIVAADAANSFRSTNGHPKPYKLEGIGVDFTSKVLNTSIIDEFIPVNDDQAIGMLRHLASKSGLLVGPSSGAVAYAADVYSKKLTADDLAVIIFGDSGRAYLTKGFYAQDNTHTELSGNLNNKVLELQL